MECTAGVEAHHSSDRRVKKMLRDFCLIGSKWLQGVGWCYLCKTEINDRHQPIGFFKLPMYVHESISPLYRSTLSSLLSRITDYKEICRIKVWHSLVICKATRGPFHWADISWKIILDFKCTKIARYIAQKIYLILCHI